MKICLDTNAYSAFKQGNNTVVEIIENADAVYVPTVVLGELYAGFFMGGRAQKNTSDLNEFLDLPGVEELSPTKSVAERYGMLVAALQKKGKPIPTNDIWIAAMTLETGSRLVSFDRHYDEIAGLVVVGRE